MVLGALLLRGRERRERGKERRRGEEGNGGTPPLSQIPGSAPELNRNSASSSIPRLTLSLIHDK